MTGRKGRRASPERLYRHGNGDGYPVTHDGAVSGTGSSPFTAAPTPKTHPHLWTLCRPGECGCMYGDCERMRAAGETRGYMEHTESGVLGVNDTGPRLP